MWGQAKWMSSIFGSYRRMLWVDPVLPDSIENLCSLGNVLQKHIGLHNMTHMLLGDASEGSAFH